MRKFLPVIVMTLCWAFFAGAQQQYIILPGFKENAKSGKTNEERIKMDEFDNLSISRPPKKLFMKTPENENTDNERLLSYKLSCNGTEELHFMSYDEYGIIKRDSSNTGKVIDYSYRWKEPGKIWQSKSTSITSPGRDAYVVTEDRTFHDCGSVESIKITYPDSIKIFNYDEEGYQLSDRTIYSDGSENSLFWTFFAPEDSWIETFTRPDERRTIELEGDNGYIMTYEELVNGALRVVRKEGRWYEKYNRIWAGISVEYSWDENGEVHVDDYNPGYNNRWRYLNDEGKIYQIYEILIDPINMIWKQETVYAYTANYFDSWDYGIDNKDRIFVLYNNIDGEWEEVDNKIYSWISNHIVKVSDGKRENIYYNYIHEDGSIVEGIYYNLSTGEYGTFEYENPYCIYCFYDASDEIISTIRSFTVGKMQYWEKLINDEWHPCEGELIINPSSYALIILNFDEQKRLVSYKNFIDSEFLSQVTYQYTDKGFIERHYKLNGSDGETLFLTETKEYVFEENGIYTEFSDYYSETGEVYWRYKTQTDPNRGLELSYKWNNDDWSLTGVRVADLVETDDEGAEIRIYRKYNIETDSIFPKIKGIFLRTPKHHLNQREYYAYWMPDPEWFGDFRYESIILEEPNFEKHYPQNPAEDNLGYFTVKEKSKLDEYGNYPQDYYYFYHWGWTNDGWKNFTDDPISWDIIDDTTLVYHISKFNETTLSQLVKNGRIKVNQNRMITEVLDPLTFNKDEEQLYQTTRIEYDEKRRMIKYENINELTKEFERAEYTYGDITWNSIDEVEHDKSDTATVIRVYNLQGIQVLNNAGREELKSLPKGLYIVNGKKMWLNN